VRIIRLGFRDLHSLTGVYALDALDDRERDRFERHLRGCRACADEVRDFAATVAVLGMALAAEPPPAVRERVLAVAVTRRPSPVAANKETARRRSRVQPRLGLPRLALPRLALARLALARLALAVGAAGLAVSVAVSVVAVDARHRLSTAAASTAAITAVLSAPDARIASAPTSAGGTATVIASAARRAMVFTSSGLRPLPASRVYELWFLGPGAPRRAGLVPAPSGGSTAPVLAAGLAPGDRVGVTVEPAGGTSAPTTTPVVVLAQ